MGFDIGIDENLLSRELEEDGARQGLDDRDVVVGVHLLHDPADVSNGQTVEDVQQDDDHQKDEQGENQVAEPVSKLFQEKDASHSKFGFFCHVLVTNEDNNEDLIIFFFLSSRKIEIIYCVSIDWKYSQICFSNYGTSEQKPLVNNDRPESHPKPNFFRLPTEK